MKDRLRKLKPKSKTWRNLLLAAAITLAVMSVTILVLGCQYQTNDDYAMSLTASGAYGEISANLIFTNTVMGNMLAWLYLAVPSLNWYAWTHLLLLLFASTACVFLILDSVRNGMRMLIAFVFLGVSIIPMVMQVQFTQVAYICITAGFAFFAYAFLKPQKRKKRTAMLTVSLLLCLAGVMIRDRAILSIAPFFVLFAGYRLFKGDRRPVIWMLAVCALCGVGVYADSAAYKSQQWQDYLKFNASRAALLDSPQLDYDKNKDVFDAVGWSKADYDIFYSWMLADDEHFTTEKLTYIKDHSRWEPVTVGSAITDFAEGLRSPLVFYPFCMLLIGLLLCLLTREKKLPPLFITLAVLCEHFVFIIMQRPVDRTVYPHYVLGILLLLLLADYSRLRFVWKKRAVERDMKNAAAFTVIGSCLLICILMNVMLTGSSYGGQKENYGYFPQLDQYIAGNKDKLFLSSSVAGNDRYKGYGIFEPPQKGMLENFCLLGGWYTKSPRYYQFANQTGYDNLFLCLLDDNVYLIESGYPTVIEQYLREDYRIETEATQVAAFGGLGVYKLSEIEDIGGQQ